ncbi:MAG: PAS domain-containing sensor histidine kinase [Halodesulfurarchaeum sp.]
MSSSRPALSTEEIPLQQWERFMEQLPEITPIVDISCLLTPEHEFRCINESATAAYEMSQEGFIGERCYELVHGRDEPIEACPCQEVLETGEAKEGTVFEEDGRYYLAAAAPIYGADGEIRALAHTVRDVTERTARERELEARSAAMEASIDGIGILDEDQTYVFVNQAHADIYGYRRPADFEGESWRMCYEEAELERFEAKVLPQLFANGHWRGEATGLRRDGSTFPQELSLSVTDSGRIVCVVRDITERKRQERELERKNERLEEFASAVSHDLRNPLNVAQGRTELAREVCDCRHLEQVAASIDRSLEIVEDLLSLARNGEGVHDREWFDLAEVVGECWAQVAAPAATLEIDASLSIHADRSRVQQLLENLLRNAVEHGGQAVSIVVGELDDGTGFYLADDGPGIPEGEREAVFEMGYSTADRGTGLGLSIAREIAESHDWGLTVTESGAGGARFEVSNVRISDP